MPDQLRFQIKALNVQLKLGEAVHPGRAKDPAASSHAISGHPQACDLDHPCGARLARTASVMDYDPGYFDDTECRLEPADNPFGTKLSPMTREG